MNLKHPTTFIWKLSNLYILKYLNWLLPIRTTTYYTCKKRRWGSSRRRAVKSFLELEVEICWIRRRLDVLFGWWCSSSNTNVGSENGEVRREKFFFSAPAKPLFSTRAENWKVRKLKSIICMIMTRWSSACNWFTLLQIPAKICMVYGCILLLLCNENT